MKYINPVPYIEGNLTEVPCGISHSQWKKNLYRITQPKDMNKFTRYSNKLSQRMWHEYLCDTFLKPGQKYLNNLAMEIYCGKDHKLTFRGSPEEIRLEAYKMCKKVGATLNPRKGKKTNTDFTFRIFAA
tara:strand:+ start:82 stop:468 length:387 start_codon:yes stop_codon:yes gene_type:complete